MFWEVTHAVTSKVKRMNVLGMNARVFLESEGCCCTRKGRISAPAKIKVFNAPGS